MNRFVILTVGKTHSGKTTFAKALEQQLTNSLVIDQDNHADFINTYYKNLLPTQGPNTLKYSITKTIVDYAINQTKLHLILCNSNRSYKSRLGVLSRFRSEGFLSILVHFEIPDQVLQERVSRSTRSTTIFRSASSFEEVLIRQQADSHKPDVIAPVEGEADHLFAIKSDSDVQAVIEKIVNIVD